MNVLCVVRPSRKLFCLNIKTYGPAVRCWMSYRNRDTWCKCFSSFHKLHDSKGIGAIGPNHRADFAVNRHKKNGQLTKEILRSLVWQFKAPIRFAVAYGSGVFSQGASSGPPMVDLIFGVTYTQHWHFLNLQQHPQHYSFLGKLGSATVAYTQDKLGAGVYFNPYVDINGITIKYGVINIETICQDLTDWDNLYLAGRLQKPVKTLRDDPRVSQSNQLNLISAVRTALLLLPEKFSEKNFYSTIAAMSYLGDPRMKLFAENPHKIDNIVNNQISYFRHLYLPFINQLPNISLSSGHIDDDPQSNPVLIQNMNPISRGNMVCRLPITFRNRLYNHYRHKLSLSAYEFNRLIDRTEEEKGTNKELGNEIDRNIAQDTQNLKSIVSSVIKSTVAWPSTTQSIKGLASAGPLKSVRYLREKVEKWKTSRKMY